MKILTATRSSHDCMVSRMSVRLKCWCERRELAGRLAKACEERELYITHGSALGDCEASSKVWNQFKTGTTCN